MAGGGGGGAELTGESSLLEAEVDVASAGSSMVLFFQKCGRIYGYMDGWMDVVLG